jgi:hypothetical protein
MILRSHKVSSGDKKKFFNAAANGLLTHLIELVSKKPDLLKIGNKDSGKLGIFYSLKNKHLETTLFLYKMGQRFSDGELRSIIFSSRKADLDYLFLTNLFSRIEFNFENKSKEEFNEWIIDRLKYSCYNRNDIVTLERLYQTIGITPDWNKILTEYRTYKNIGKGTPNINTIPFIREITLKYLLDEF